MALVTAAIDLTYTAVGGAILFCGVLVSFTLLVSKTNNSSATNGVGNSNETVNNTTVNSVGNSVVSTVGIGQSHPSTMCKEYNNCVYMDYNATTPVFVEVFAAMEPYLTTCFGNPSSAHAFARPCKQAVLSARKQVGELLCCRNSDKEIVFTSCGSESDNRAIDIALSYFNSRNSVEESKPRVITSAIEHPAVLCYLRQLVIKTLIELVVLPVDSEGFVDLEKLKQSLTVSTALVTIMHSNNEVGTIQPIKSIASAVRKFNSKNKSSVLIHSDGAQSLGKVLVDVTSLDVDMFTVVGHKFGAPKGIAALYINSKTLSDVVSLCPMLIGGGQEMGLRAGTENVAYMVGLGEASRLALVEADELLLHLLTLKLRLLTVLTNSLSAAERSKIRFNGPLRCNNTKELSFDLKILRTMQGSNSHSQTGYVEKRTSLFDKYHPDQLPNTTSVSFQGVLSSEIIGLLLDKVACSAGSACHSVGESDHKTVVVSEVLQAMAVPKDFAAGTLRLSVGRHTTLADVDQAVEEIVTAVRLMWNRTKL